MMLTAHRRDGCPEHGPFCAMALQADLLDGWVVAREWGRIGSAGHVRADVHGIWHAGEVCRGEAGTAGAGRGIGDVRNSAAHPQQVLFTFGWGINKLTENEHIRPIADGISARILCLTY